jgi:hypothetical protein
MSKVDIRLLYQQRTGLCLDDINNIAAYPKIMIDCEECGDTIGEVEIDDEIREYIEWLEETLEAALSVGERLLISHDLLLGNETSEEKQNPRS